jgi:hypothetical protein
LGSNLETFLYDRLACCARSSINQPDSTQLDRCRSCRLNWFIVTISRLGSNVASTSGTISWVLSSDLQSEIWPGYSLVVLCQSGKEVLEIACENGYCSLVTLGSKGANHQPKYYSGVFIVSLRMFLRPFPPNINLNLHARSLAPANKTLRR